MDLRPLQKLLETEMDRKEFLAYVGALILAVVGIAGIIESLSSPSRQNSTQPNNKVGYGSSTYGDR